VCRCSGGKNVLDHKHATDFTFVFNVSSEVTQTSLFGLSAALFGNLKSGQRRQGEAASPRAAEALLVYAAVFGLAMMLACSMPPVVTNTRHREKVVNKFVRVAACLLVTLVATAAFAAVVPLLQGYIVVALAVVTGVSVVWFLKLYKPRAPAATPPVAVGAPAAGAQHPSQFLRNHWNVVLWPGLYPAMFGALMAVYSQQNNCQPMGKLYKTTVFFAFLAIVSNLARMIILREGGRRNKMRIVSVGVTIASMALALIFIVLLV
jgi:hypothetical protein